MRKLAIVGYAHPSKDRSPFDNLDYDIWGMNYLYYRIPRATMWFEMHEEDYEKFPVHYHEWLRNQEIPIMMTRKYQEIKSSMRYPIEAITKEYGTFFNCTVDYMLAFAIWLQYTHIELYGIHCLEQYEFEKRGINYWLGICRGKGIDFFLPDEADILKPIFYGYKEVPIEKNTNDKRH